VDVLVVSDDPHLREEARYGFPQDTNVRFAFDSRDALAEIFEDAPDAIVVDLKTGSAGGFNLIRSMRQDSRARNVPSLLLIERPQDAWLAKQAGATLTRVKPLDVLDLVDDTLSIAEPAKAS
jgi:DNA-binding response OmpR family regulator